MKDNFSKLEEILGYEFKDKNLLKRAVTHRSWAYENQSGLDEFEIRQVHNEALEFVGDSVLGISVAEFLFRKYQKASEGELTLMKHKVVSAPILANAAEINNIGDFMLVGRGEEKTGGRKKQALLADVFEAILGAIFFDSDYLTARDFVYRILKTELEEITPDTAIDYKTQLQELFQAEKRPSPVYKVIKREGKPHCLTFFVKVTWDTGEADGTGTSIKSAEMLAAKSALEKLQINN